MTQAVIFISYSHKNEREKDKLLSHLGVLQRQGLIGLWSDDRIGAGADWKQDISEAMAQARVAILLISANFLTSDFILGEEVPTLLKRRKSEGLTVFPVIAKACAWQEVGWLTEMNVRPKNGRPIWGGGSRRVDEDLAAIAKEIAAIVKTGAAPIAPTVSGVYQKSERAENPYRPGKYVTDQQFYGREALLRQLEGDSYRGAYIIGTRQMGKTSLLREMERRLPAFYMDVSYLGRDLSRWAKSLQRDLGKKRATYAWLPDPATTAASDFFDILEQVAQAAEDHRQKVWLLLDEAEDLMSLSEVHPRFLAQLRGATEMLPALRLILAGYRSLLELRQPAPPYYLSPLLGGFIALILPPLSEMEATGLIRQEQTPPGIQVEEGVVKKILSETGGHPFLLQRLCNYLWQEGLLQSPDDTIQYRIDTDADNVFPADFKLLSAPEQQILLALCQPKEATFAEIETLLKPKGAHLSKSLQDLVDLGFLYRTLTAYAISGQILARWLASKDAAEVPQPISDPVVIELHPLDEQEKRLKELLKVHLDNLHHFEEIKARYGFDVPLHVINGFQYEEEAVQKLRQELEDLRRSRTA